MIGQAFKMFTPEASSNPSMYQIGYAGSPGGAAVSAVHNAVAKYESELQRSQAMDWEAEKLRFQEAGDWRRAEAQIAGQKDIQEMANTSHQKVAELQERGSNYRTTMQGKQNIMGDWRRGKQAEDLARLQGQITHPFRDSSGAPLIPPMQPDPKVETFRDDAGQVLYTKTTNYELDHETGKWRAVVETKNPTAPDPMGAFLAGALSNPGEGQGSSTRYGISPEDGSGGFWRRRTGPRAPSSGTIEAINNLIQIYEKEKQ